MYSLIIKFIILEIINSWLLWKKIFITYTAVIEKCPDTGLYIGYIPGIAGAHSQGKTIEEVQLNLQEVLEMLSEDGNLEQESEFIGTQSIKIPQHV